MSGGSKGKCGGQPLPRRNNASKPLTYKPASPRRRAPQPQAPLPSPGKPLRSRKGAWIIGGLALYSFTAYGAYLFYAYKRAIEESQNLDVPVDVLDRYDETAEGYDSEVSTAEWITGLLRLRKKLAREAQGDVLEVAVGTGRNMEYYPLDKCRSLTMVDQSKQMIEVARRKFQDTREMNERLMKTRLPELHPEYANLTFRTTSAESPIPSPPAQGFDTVIQTMGLCSTPRPALLLQNIGAVTNPEHGRILLLEHGRSHYRWLNNILDNLAPVHAHRYGCWWNRDIGRIVEESGLEVVRVKRYHMGTTWWVELRPKSRTLESSSEGKKEAEKKA
ncbi:MAG: hypothetical protein M1819_003928 [Sarea resinae]|nr:MAG: hypothetical protein M1819_003928 [Sarea resinae]